MGVLTGQEAVGCLSSVRDLPLWPTPSAIGQLRFCKNKDKHRDQAKAKATMAWEQALG